MNLYDTLLWIFVKSEVVRVFQNIGRSKAEIATHQKKRT